MLDITHAATSNPLWNTLWKHRKRGGFYRIITTTASLQFSKAAEFGVFGDEDWTVYQNTESGSIWVRPTEEFMDGRFEQITA